MNAGKRISVSREEVLYMIYMHHLFLIHVGSGFGRLYHLDAFGKSLAGSGLQRCDYFLCHGLKLFNFTMYGHLPEDRIEFLQFQSF